MLYRFLLLFLLSISVQAYTQRGNQSIQKDTTYTLVGDTLFSNKNFKVFVGQKIVVGKPNGERDWYNTISFKSGMSWPLVFLKEAETEQNIEYQADPTMREKDKVKEYVSPGDTLVITKIKRFGRKKSGYWYHAFLSQNAGPLSLNFRCYIVDAIRSKEVLLPER